MQNINTKSCLSIEVKKKDIRMDFIFPHGASYQDCYDALQEAAQHIVKIAGAASEAQKVQESAAEAEGAEDGSKSA